MFLLGVFGFVSVFIHWYLNLLLLTANKVLPFGTTNVRTEQCHRWLHLGLLMCVVTSVLCCTYIYRTLSCNDLLVFKSTVNYMPCFTFSCGVNGLLLRFFFTIRNMECATLSYLTVCPSYQWKAHHEVVTLRATCMSQQHWMVGPASDPLNSSHSDRHRLTGVSTTSSRMDAEDSHFGVRSQFDSSALLLVWGVSL